jgi:hypothetical protein
MVLLADPNTPDPKRPSELYFSEFDIPREKVPRAWGWSRSSLKDLFAIGQKAGTDLAEQMRNHNHL